MSKKWQNVSRQGMLDCMKRKAKGISRRDRPVYLLPVESPSSAATAQNEQTETKEKGASDELRGNATLKKRASHLEGKSCAVAGK